MLSAPTLPPALHITRSRHARPPARRVAFCDGGVDDSFREGIDVELSHWIPNRTPAAFKAPTSTGIALNFVASGAGDEVDLVVNNHVDTDGMLSVFVLLHPQLALAHRPLLEQAAAMGDFHGWGEADAQHLFQLMALTRARLQADKLDPQDIYTSVHSLVRRVLGGERFDEARTGVAALQRAVAAVEQGSITRTLLAPRLVHYVLPSPADDAACLPPLDSPVPEHALLPPQVRSRWDAERLQLLSSPVVTPNAGWRHDLCWPGYAWAETPGLWHPPGLRDEGSSNRHWLQHPPLDRACAELNALDTSPGRWAVATALGPFEALPGRPFPVVLSCMEGDKLAVSALPPAQVAAVVAAALGIG